MDPLFAPLPEDLSSLSDDALSTLLDERVSVGRQIETDPDAVAARCADAQDFREQLAEGVRQVEAIRVVQAEREQAAEEITAAVDDSLRTLLGTAETPAEPEEGDTPAEEPEAPEAPAEEPETPAEPEAETPVDAEVPAAEPELELPLAASGRGIPAGRVMRRPQTRRVEPDNDEAEQHMQITALADVPGYSAGARMADFAAIGQAMAEKRAHLGVGGNGERVPVARLTATYPDERKLLATHQDASGTENISRVRAILDPIMADDQLAASGAFCQPVNVYYGQEDVGTTARPVRDALANFNADRGGIRFAPPLTLADIDGGIGIITQTQADAGGSGATKDCLTLECPEFQEVKVDSVYRCITFDNLGSRTWPERVTEAVSLWSQAFSRLAETNLLDAISGNCTAVTLTAQVGVITTALEGIMRAVAGYRSRHRTTDTYRLHLMVPSWLSDVLVADLISSQFDRFSRDEAGVEALLSQRCGVNLSFYLDTETGAGQVFAAQSAGEVNAWPDPAVLYLYPEGTMLLLDSGSLDFGLVRDSTLNSTNDYQMFAEVFEQVAFIGNEALRIELDTCPTGETGGTGTITCGS